MDAPRFSLRSTVLGTPDPRGLASFYQSLLDWELVADEDEWVVIAASGGKLGRLAFQLEQFHVPPTWPAGPDDQQMQVHLDIGVSSLESGVERAESLGAKPASYQPQDDVRVMIDPAGHPFCLFELA